MKIETIAKQATKSLVLLGALLCWPSAMQAQITVVDEDDDEIENDDQEKSAKYERYYTEDYKPTPHEYVEEE